MKLKENELMPKIVLAQAKPILFDKQANLEKMESSIKKASADGADLILFPELFLTGYFTRDRTLELAEDFEGPSIKQIQEMAKSNQIKVVFGFPEKMNGLVYNSAAFIGENGLVIGSFQKVHLWDEESKYFQPGSTFKVWPTNIGTIGIMICYDTEFPESARSLALQGADMILAPTANMAPFQHVQQLYIQTRAAENQVFVATTNQIGYEENTFFFGESAAADPNGQLLAKLDDSEGNCLIDIDLSLIQKAREFPCYLQDRRSVCYIE
jgi:5-aminopentanamidase